MYEHHWISLFTGGLDDCCHNIKLSNGLSLSHKIYFKIVGSTPILTVYLSFIFYLQVLSIKNDIKNICCLIAISRQALPCARNTETTVHRNIRSRIPSNTLAYSSPFPETQKLFFALLFYGEISIYLTLLESNAMILNTIKIHTINIHKKIFAQSIKITHPTSFRWN